MICSSHGIIIPWSASIIITIIVIIVVINIIIIIIRRMICSMRMYTSTSNWNLIDALALVFCYAHILRIMICWHHLKIIWMICWHHPKIIQMICWHRIIP
jgi:hypothetical protein